MYEWIKTLQACPKSNPNNYPPASPEALQFFNQAAQAEQTIPRTVPQETIARGYLKSAQLGYWRAMHNIALSYYSGEGVPEDHQQALFWFKELEKFALPESYNAMAYVYQVGIGVEADAKIARQYRIKAAQAGDAEAQYNLGHTLYNQQREIPRYGDYGIKMWQCAAEQGHKEAFFDLAGDAKATKRMDLAYRYYVQGAKAGSGACLRALSDAYAHTPKYPTFNLAIDMRRAICLEELDKKLDTNPDLTFPDLDSICPPTVPQPNEYK